MKKLLKGIVCAGICASFALTGLVGCGGIESAHRDSEKDALRLAIGAADGNFNPLFYTSANDGTLANLTQVSLMTTNEKGKLSYGNDYPTVALDYKETYYSDAEGTIKIGEGDGEKITGSSDKEGSTAYEYVIKNGIKFSDGVDLTVMDVLFNLYVYLDPLYSGSATIYSTKIKGLQAYRQQDPDAEDDADESLTEYYAKAEERIADLINWSNGDYKGEVTDQMKEDLKTVRKLYKQELETDWNNLSTAWEDTYKDYYFTSAWQAFYFAEGVVSTQTYNKKVGTSDTYVTADLFYDVNGNEERDDGEKYLTEFDPEFTGLTSSLKENPANSSNPISQRGQQLTDEINQAVTDKAVQDFMAANEGYSAEEARLKLQGDFAVESVLESRAGLETDTEAGAGISYILQYCATASNAFDEFVRDERGKNVPTGKLPVETISGITVRRSREFNGKDLGEEHDIVRILIKGVDPKAKWNFSLAIAPMHYYSDSEHTNAAMADYAAYKQAYASGTTYTLTKFGVQYKSADFMNNVLAASSKTNLPVGAGPYKACSYKMNGEAVTGGTFHYNKKAYYERNEYFTTLGSGIENAKIKYVTYREMSDDKIVSALKANEIDYGTPIAKSANQKEVNYGNLKQTTYQTGGYGYVGINPKSEKLRSVYVRQAIMYAMDTSSIIQYYGQGLVSLINRPMSLTSWASPEIEANIPVGQKAPSRYYEMTADVLNGKSEEQFIRDLVGKSGQYSYNERTGKITDYSGNQLELTFTIAGESTDHPSYNMFISAKAFLERCGFKINVEHSALALQKLTTGDLEVWAAAWSSAIDPDPYQIYSMYSNASSTKNWYKSGIEQDGGSDSKNLAYEYNIAVELTERIETGREQLDQTDRINTYSRSSTTKKLSDATSDTEWEQILNQLCCLDLIMELAVEFPTYQRNELCVYNASVIDESTIRTGEDASYNMGPIDELWKVGYRK
ncbi:MAG: ABC transporter substrate-binding protein [Candidatus Coproplasma sp.]